MRYPNIFQLRQERNVLTIYIPLLTELENVVRWLL